MQLANSGYVFHDAAEAATLAEPLDGRTVAELTRIAAAHVGYELLAVLARNRHP